MFCRQQLIQNKGDVEVKFDGDGQNSGALLTITGGTSGRTVKLSITNKSRSNPVVLSEFSHFYLYKQCIIKLSDTEMVSSGKTQHTIPPKRESIVPLSL